MRGRGQEGGGECGGRPSRPRAAAPASCAEFLVYRWSPESDQPPRYDSYKIDINA